MTDSGLFRFRRAGSGADPAGDPGPPDSWEPVAGARKGYGEVTVLDQARAQAGWPDFGMKLLKGRLKAETLAWCLGKPEERAMSLALSPPPYPGFC